MAVNQYEIYLVGLDPTIGQEIKKTRPCVVLSPDELNHNIGTVIVAPMTTRSKPYPTRVEIHFQQKLGFIVLDQLRTVDRRRLVKRLGSIDQDIIEKIKSTLSELLVE